MTALREGISQLHFKNKIKLKQKIIKSNNNLT